MPQYYTGQGLYSKPAQPSGSSGSGTFPISFSSGRARKSFSQRRNDLSYGVCQGTLCITATEKP